METSVISLVTLTEILTKEYVVYSKFDFEKIKILKNRVFLTLKPCVSFLTSDVKFFECAFSKYGFVIDNIFVDAILINDNACLVLSFFVYEKS